MYLILSFCLLSCYLYVINTSISPAKRSMPLSVINHVDFYRETIYEREMTLSTWPAKKYMLSAKLDGMSGVLEYSKQRYIFGLSLFILKCHVCCIFNAQSSWTLFKNVTLIFFVCFCRENLLMVNVFFSDLSTEMTEEEKAFTVSIKTSL